MNHTKFTVHIEKLTEAIQNAITRDLPEILGNKAASMFRQNFQNEGFFGKSWKEVKRRIHRTRTIKLKSGKRKTLYIPPAKGADGRRKILTGKTGNLGRSIRYKVGKGQAIVYSDVVYAKIHNEGGKAGRNHKVTIPKRPFLANSPKLEAELKKLITKHLSGIIKH